MNPLALGALFLAAFLWGSSFIVIKDALGVFHPLALMFLRMAAALLAFLPFAPAFRAVRVARADRGLFCLMFVCEPCLYFLCESFALRYTSASQAGMVIATMPLFTALGAWALFRERIGAPVWAGIFLSTAGVVWLCLCGADPRHAPHPVFGNLLEAGSALAAALYALAVKRLSQRYPALFLAALQAAAGTVFFGGALVVTGTGLPRLPDLASWWPVFYLGIVITLGAFGLYNYGLSRMPAPVAAVFLNGIPVFALVLSILFLDEALTTSQGLASALVLGGVFLCGRASGNGPAGRERA